MLQRSRYVIVIWLAADRLASRQRLGAQCGLGKSVDLRNGSTRNAEDLQAAPSEGYPRFERADAFGAQALDQRTRNLDWQLVRHVHNFSYFRAFAKWNLTSCCGGFAI